MDRLAALDPSIVVAGHKKPGAPDSPSAIEETKRYLLDSDLYPHWVANQSWLMFGFPGA